MLGSVGATELVTTTGTAKVTQGIINAGFTDRTKLTAKMRITSQTPVTAAAEEL